MSMCCGRRRRYTRVPPRETGEVALLGAEAGEDEYTSYSDGVPAGNQDDFEHKIEHEPALAYDDPGYELHAQMHANRHATLDDPGSTPALASASVAPGADDEMTDTQRRALERMRGARKPAKEKNRQD